ncbi:MAG TPA: ABC transporter permease subunit [Rhizomicrobium sp.]
MSGLRLAYGATAPTLATSLGAACAVVVLLLTVAGPFAGPFDPDAIDLAGRLQAPDATHWFGTDELGRDLFARIAAGGRYSLLTAVAVVLVSCAGGTLLGAACAVVPRWLDAAAMRAVDIFLSIPALVLAMALAAALGPGLQNAMIALTVARLPALVRLARNQALSLRRRGFVEAAQLYGAGRFHQLRHHILPNIAPVMIVQGVSDVSGIVLAGAALGFLGLGAQPPTPEWGALVASGRLYFLSCWWTAAFPGAAIAMTAIAFNLLGDGAREALDPSLRPSVLEPVAP